ncbi:MAG TPA: VCBS repeat-containing protein [Planctomycetota bacterium]|nr:VCBS repeat-containing protein [Planctomycetota bacterium]
MGGKNGWVGILCAAAAAAAIGWFLIPRTRTEVIVHTVRPPPIDAVTDYDAMEDAQALAGGFLKKAVSGPLTKKDFDGLGASFTADFRARFATVEEGKRLDEDGLGITDFAGAAVPETGADDFLKRLKALADRYTAISRSQFRCFTFLLDKGGRRDRGLYHWWLSGQGPDHRRLEVQGDFAVDFAGPVGDWKISRIEFPAPDGQAQLVESARSAFADITDPTGFEFAYSAEGRAALQSVIDNRTMTNVGALSAVDWNRDGFPDLIATNENRRTVLFLNDGRGGFTPKELPEQGGLFYLHLDLDGDGVEELVSTHPKWYRETRACLGLYVRDGDAWKFREALVFDNPPTNRELLFHHVAAGDANGDGKLDLFITGYNNSQSSGLDFNFLDAKSGQRDLLFINQGGLKFSEEGEARGIRDRRYGYAAEFFDFDSDGDLDLLVVNDFGPDNYYENRGNAVFDERPDHPLVRDPAFGMGLAIADFDNEGKFSVYVSNMYSHAGNRMIAVTRTLREDTRHKLLFSVRGNALYEPENGWKETGIPRGVARADWAWGCVFFDLENDGDKDLFVANGFTTHSDPAAPDY